MQLLAKRRFTKMQKQQSATKPNKKLLLIGLPLAVVVPLLLASYFIGPASIWLWVGVGLGMLYVSWKVKQQKPAQKPDDNGSEPAQ